MTHWDLYWITRLDGVAALATAFSTIFSFGTIFVNGIGWGMYSDGYEEYKKMGIIGLFLIPVALLSILVSVLIPTTKEMALIYVAPKVVNSEVVGEVSGEIKEITSMAMDKMKEILEVGVNVEANIEPSAVEKR